MTPEKIEKLTYRLCRRWHITGDMREEAVAVAYLAAVESNYDPDAVRRSVDAWRQRELRLRRRFETGWEMD
jgi:hypothetical protein